MSNLEPNQNRRQFARDGYALRSAPRQSSMRRPAGEDENEISVKFLMSVWNQWWKWLIPISLMLLVGSASIVMMTFKPKYRASSRINISEQAPWLIQRDADPKASKFVATQIEMLRSPLVLSAALSDPKINQMSEIKKRLRPVDWLMEKGLEIEPVGQSTLVEIAFSGVDPEASSHLVNTIVDEYFHIQNKTKTDRIQGLANVLRKNKQMQEAIVTSLQRRVKTLSKNLGIVLELGPNPTIMNRQNPAQEIMDLIRQEEFAVADLEAQVNAIQDSLDPSSVNVSSPALIAARIATLPEVRQLREDIRQKEVMLGQLEATAKNGKASNFYINAQNELREMKERLGFLRDSSENQVVAELRELDRADVESNLRTAQIDLEQKKALVQRLEKRYDAERAKLSKEGGKKLELDFATQDLARALNLLAKIAEREAQVTAELGAPGRLELFREAKPNYIPNQKLPVELLAASALASLLIPFGIAFIFENSVRRISTAEQLEQKTNADVIGEVSRLPARNNRRTRAVGHDLGLFEESIDSLRTSLLLSNEDSEMQVLSVCSAVSGEGKTSVSSQLAVSIARSTGQPTLLIDGDMRAPDIHQIFEIPLSAGLADVLDGKVALDDAINRSWSEHVHLLPAGELSKSPHKLLGSSALRILLEEARRNYRYVVIDTPPVLAASEALVIAKSSDRTIVCAMRDFSRESHVRMAHERLRSTGADTLGTVLNGVPVRRYAARYGSYGRYGYNNPSS